MRSEVSLPRTSLASLEQCVSWEPRQGFEQRKAMI